MRIVVVLVLADATKALQTVAAIAVVIAGLIFAFAGRVLALEVVADAARGVLAVTIGTALAADVGRLAEAAEETVAAVVLAVVTTRGGNIQDAAGLIEFAAAADVLRDAGAAAADLVVIAVVVVVATGVQVDNM